VAMTRILFVSLLFALSLPAQDTPPVLRRKPATTTPPPPAEDPAAPPATTQKPVPKDPKDPEPPKLKRTPGGVASPSAPAKSEPVVGEIVTDADGKEIKRTGAVKGAPANLDDRLADRNRTIPEDEPGRPAARPPGIMTEQDLVEAAAESAFAFTENLPNFICDQITWRHQSETRNPSWKPQDRVENELVFFDGKEEYRNIRIGGKPLKKGSPMDSGTWSMGEFGTVLVDIYHPRTDAAFKYRAESMAAGLKAKVYDVTVKQANSHWKVVFEKTIYPGYVGSVWIDPVSKRTLRIEMQAKNMPGDFKLDHLELAMDYGWVTISGQKYLLPVKSENVSCFRGTYMCTKNEIEFKNYRKFTAESQVLNVESELSFPQAESKVSVPGEKKKDEKKQQ
jgi:hypothetical protein